MSSIIKGNFRPGSRRGAGLRMPLNTRQVGQWLYCVGGAVEVKSATYKIAGVLAALIGPDGRLDPTMRWVAEKVSLSEKTVQRALRRLAGLGFLTWHRRTAVTDGIEHQTSNAYQLRLPDTPPVEPALEPLSTPPVSSMSDNREEPIYTEKELSDISPLAALRQMPARIVRASLAALARRRKQFEAQQRAKLQAKSGHGEAPDKKHHSSPKRMLLSE